MLRFLLPVFTTLLLFTISTPKESPSLYYDTVNAVIGDVSYTATFGEEPDESAPEKIRIQTHLEHVIDLLRASDTNHLNAEQKQNRRHLIKLLKDYKEAGEFPKNRHFQTRRPVFMDENGNLCAVGYLIAQTEGIEVAKAINRDHKFNYIKDIDPKLIDGWLAKNGITKTEAAMIQPAYGGVYTETIEQNEVELEYAIGSSLLAGMQLGTTTYSLIADNSPSAIRKVSAFNTLLGMGSLTLGLVNLDNTYTEVSFPTGDPQFCTICYDRYEYTYKNPARTNFSIANIVVGGLSAAFNGYSFFKAGKQEEPSRFNVTAAQLYDPSTQTTTPGLSLSMKF